MVCVCSLENVALIVLALEVPQSWKGGQISPRRSQKGSQTPQPFPQGLFLPSGLGILCFCFFFSAKGVVPVYEAAALGNQGGYKSQQRGWDHFARRLPSPEGLLAQSLENYVIFNRGPAPQKAWMGWV